jgi:alkanesulfonate monooxygenase SsuD/methylene tetrahydromethanopterin reductase-like flavin-dependent oxidoreductase (luciferase family)
VEVGVQLIFASDGWPGITDQQLYDEEVRIALLAEELGFDVVWAAEHHFFGYSLCPDNTQFLAYVAGATSRVDVGTAAVIMPWHEPLRVAEKIAMLDHLTHGRLRFGLGRGLSRREFAAFEGMGIKMEESRGRFDEGTTMVLEALRTGVIEGEGTYFTQPRIEIRPRPERSFADRIYTVASSDDSIESAARFGGHLMMFADRNWEARYPSVERYRDLYRQFHDGEPPRVMTSDFTLCVADESVAEERATRYMGTYLASLLEHYEVMGSHFADTEGYDAYAKAAEVLRKIGESGFLEGFMQAGAWGTPDMILEQLERRRDLLGSYELATTFRFGGIPFEEAEASMRLYAKEVLPVLHEWD